MPGEQLVTMDMDADEQKWAIEEAARTLKDFARISKDPDLVKKAQAYLDEESQDIDAASKLINSLSAKTADFQVQKSQ